jgi:hypothetical protein
MTSPGVTQASRGMWQLRRDWSRCVFANLSNDMLRHRVTTLAIIRHPVSAATPMHHPTFVTVVSGLPRSGTSMVMQMVHAGGMPAVTDGVRIADPDNPRGYFELERVKSLRTDRSWLPEARGKVIKVIHMLLPELPVDQDYRVLFVERDLDEVIASQQKMLTRLGRPGAALPSERLRAAFQGQLRQVREWLAQRPQFQVLPVQYAAVVREPRAAAAAINRWLGGGLDETAMAVAVDPHLYRNRH